MTNRTRNMCLLISVLGFAMAPLYLTGCDREVSHTKSVEKDDGKVKTKEKTVTQDPEGRTTVTEEKTETKPRP